MTSSVGRSNAVSKPSTVQATTAPGAAPTVADTKPAARVELSHELMTSVASAASGLSPSVAKLNALPALKALGDGEATLEVPLKAGSYKLKGLPFSVKPGTVAHVHVQVKNGELVPVGRGNAGTKVTVEPPLDLPLWVTGDGVELQGDAANSKFSIELGGMFDLHFKAKPLSELLSGGTSSPMPGADVLEQMVDLSKAKIDAKVTMRSATIDLGGAKVTVDPATVFSIKGDGVRAELLGRVKLDDFGLDQGGVKLRGSNGEADLATTLSRAGESFEIDTKLSNVAVTLDSMQSAHQSTVARGEVDHLDLGRVAVTDGTIGFKTRVGLDGVKPSAQQSPVSLALKGQGVVNHGQIFVKDHRDTARLAFSGAFAGLLELGADGVSLAADVSGAHVDIADLQEVTKSGGRLSIEHARADGALRITSNPSAGSLTIDGEATNIDVLVDDFVASTQELKADLGHTTVTGAGHFHLGGDGLKTTGHLKTQTTVESADWMTPRHTAMSLKHSVLSGDLTQLSLGKGAPELRIEHAKADLGVTNTQFKVGGIEVKKAAGNLKGAGVVVMNASGFSLQGSSQLDVAFDDGSIHSSTLDLDLASGSTAELKVSNLSIGKVNTLVVEAGSKLDAVLDSGTFRVNSQTIDIAKGGRAQFDVKRVELGAGKTELRGALRLDARMKTADLHVGAIEKPGIKLHETSVDGRVKLAIDDARLSGKHLWFDNADLSVDLNVGRYVGASVPGQPPVGTLQTPVKVLPLDAVKRQSAAQIAGVTERPAAPAKPLDALRLLKHGTLSLDVPLAGSRIHALGIDVLTFEKGAKVDLSLAIKDGKVVASDTKVVLNGVIKALGVELVGAHLDDKLRLRVDLTIAGKHLSVPVPFVHMPSDMKGLADVLTPTLTGSSSTDASKYLDLSHARLDITSAVFGHGRLSLPGGAVDVAEGSKLSFHGTPLNGELVGNVGVDAVDLSLPSVAIKGRAGRGDLKVSYHRDGDRAVVDAQLTNLSIVSDYVAHKDQRGDYFSLGAGKVSGASFALRSDVALNGYGLPNLDAPPRVESGSVAVTAFSGDLKSARVSSSVAHEPGTTELGASHVEGSLTYSLQAGLALKATVDQVDAEIKGVKLQQKGRLMDLDRARLQGIKGRLELGGGRLAFDAQQLQWDVTARALDGGLPVGELKGHQTHLKGMGQFSYDSQRDLEISGQMHIDGRLTFDNGPKAVTVSRVNGVQVRE